MLLLKYVMVEDDHPLDFEPGDAVARTSSHRQQRETRAFIMTARKTKSHNGSQDVEEVVDRNLDLP